MSHADAGFVHSDHRAGLEVITTLFEHPDQKVCRLLGLQPFDADANHGRPRGARKRHCAWRAEDCRPRRQPWVREPSLNPVPYRR